MNELALFAGAGGGILGGHLLGWRTVCAVEWEAYPASVLVARQNDKILPPFPIWDDVQTFDGKPWRGIVDVVSGGFPCQDISSAGKGTGIDGERSGMWREMARIIGEVRPKYAFVENSPMLTTRGLGTVLRDLAEMGYDAEWGVLGADDVGANHQRERIWIVAKQRYILSYPEHNRDGWGEQQSESIKEASITNTNSNNSETRSVKHDKFGNTVIAHGCTSLADSSSSRLQSGSKRIWSGCNVSQKQSENLANSIEFGIQSELSNKRKTSKWIDGNGDAKGKEFANTSSERLEGSSQVWEKNNKIRQNAELWRAIAQHSWWSVEPNVGRVVDGMASRVDRLKAIGNGQVPLCAATAWTILMERINGL
jgi:DNA (cytosine-5)-methyltransferase 1